MGAAKWGALAGLWLLYLSFGLVMASLAPMVTLIEDSLHISHSAMGSIMGAWQLVYIFAAIPCGMLLDRIGGRWALLLGVSLLSLSALGRAFAADYWSFLLATMCFGLGGPIVSAGAPKVVAQLFTGSQRGLAMGIYMTGPAIGGVVCLTMTNALLLPWFDMDWRKVMMLWAAVGFASGLVWVVLAHSLRVGAKEPYDPKTHVPQLDVMRQLISAPSVRVVLLMSVGVFLYNHGLNSWLPELLRAGGKTLVEAGYWAALPTIVGIVGSLLIPRLATPERRFYILMALCTAAMLATLFLQLGGDVSLTTGLLLQGLARSSIMTVLILTLVELPGIGEQRVGVATGMFFSAAEMGGVMGPLGMGILYDATGGFSTSLTFLSLSMAAMVVGAIVLRRMAANG